MRIPHCRVVVITCLTVVGLMCCAQTAPVAHSAPALDEVRRWVAETVLHDGVRVMGFVNDTQAILTEVSRSHGRTASVVHVMFDRAQDMPIDRVGISLSAGSTPPDEETFADVETIASRYEKIGLRPVAERAISTDSGWLLLGMGYMFRWSSGRLEVRRKSEWVPLTVVNTPTESALADLVFDRQTNTIVCIWNDQGGRGRYNWRWVELEATNLPPGAQLTWSERIAELVTHGP